MFCVATTESTYFLNILVIYTFNIPICFRYVPISFRYILVCTHLLSVCCSILPIFFRYGTNNCRYGNNSLEVWIQLEYCDIGAPIFFWYGPEVFFTVYYNREIYFIDILSVNNAQFYYTKDVMIIG